MELMTENELEKLSATKDGLEAVNILHAAGMDLDEEKELPMEHELSEVQALDMRQVKVKDVDKDPLMDFESDVQPLALDKARESSKLPIDMQLMSDNGNPAIKTQNQTVDIFKYTQAKPIQEHTNLEAKDGNQGLDSFKYVKAELLQESVKPKTEEYNQALDVYNQTQVEHSQGQLHSGTDEHFQGFDVLKYTKQLMQDIAIPKKEDNTQAVDVSKCTQMKHAQDHINPGTKGVNQAFDVVKYSKEFMQNIATPMAKDSRQTSGISNPAQVKLLQEHAKPADKDHSETLDVLSPAQTEHGRNRVNCQRAKNGKILKQCQFCNKLFTSSNLTIHMRVHTGERPYHCELCLRTFCQKNNLDSHMRMHTGERPFQCKHCNKAFFDASHLSRHAKTHSGERPHSCELCPKTFTQSAHLARHMRSHTGDRPYQCEVCSKLFVLDSHLKQHRRIHTGQRPYECELCKKTFRQSSHLAVHIRSHIGDKPYKCDKCDKCYTQAAKLAQHKSKFSH